MPAGHRTSLSSTGRGYGRYSYSYTCSCGWQGGSYGNQQSAQAAARKHEGKRG